jgi:hypothetical protein
MKYVNSTVTVPFPHELDLVIVAVHLEPKIILKIKIVDHIVLPAIRLI